MLGNDLLIGEKVRLTAITRDDLPAFTRWFSNIEILRLLNSGQVFPYTLEDEEKWFESTHKEKDVYRFAIRTLDGDNLIGNCGLFDIQRQARHGTVGIVVGEREYWGRGFGTDAMRVLIRYGFMEANLNRIQLWVYSHNPRAIASYEKIGFVHEGAKRAAIYRDGQYHDSLVMSILRREWERREGKD